MARKLRVRRGISLFETLIGAGLMVMVLAILLSFQRFTLLVWQDGMSNYGSQIEAQKAINAMAPMIREARSVVTASSGSTRVTLQMPAYNGDGSLRIPLANGDVVSYYLSNTTGSTGASGNILWRSVNGTPDSAWSMENGKGRIVLKSSGLSFAYDNSANPGMVTISFTSSSTTGTKTSQFTSTQEVMLRNKDL